MIEILDGDAIRVGAYIAATGVAVWSGWSERRRSGGDDPWPTYWFVSAGLLLALGLALAVDVAERVRDLGRIGARSDGWYGVRSTVQVVALATITITWLIVTAVVLIALWRVPARRRRYLPHAIAMTTLMAFVAARFVSLHRVDAVVYGREFAGVRYGVLVELALIASTAALALRFPRFPCVGDSSRRGSRACSASGSEQTADGLGR